MALSAGSSEGLEQVVVALRGIRDRHRLEGAYRIGKTVVDTLYGGDVRTWRRRPKSEPIYVRLENHPELPISPAGLYRSLRIFELGASYPDLLRSKILTLSHVLAVFPLPSTDQAALLRRADEEGWTVRRLRSAVEAIHNGPAPTGRPKQPAVLRTLKSVLASGDAFEGMDALLSLDRETANDLLGICAKVRAELSATERALEYAALDRSHLRILLVDGDSTFVLRARRALRQQVGVVSTAASCSEAESMVDGEVACAVIELHLPDGSGVELSRRILDRHPQISCVFTTTRERDSLPAHLSELAPLVRKTSGLQPLRVAVARALAARASQAPAVPR